MENSILSVWVGEWVVLEILCAWGFPPCILGPRATLLGQVGNHEIQEWSSFSNKSNFCFLVGIK